MIGGCDSSVEPGEPTLWEIIDSSKKVTFSLDVGGFYIPYYTNDTGYYYDVYTSLPYQSTAPTNALILKYEFGVLVDGKFSMDTSYCFYNTWHLNYNGPSYEVYLPGELRHDTITTQIDFGRRNPSKWDYPYACRLTFYDKNKRDSFVVVDSMKGSYPSNRFRGFINTSVFPDTLEDAPDDGDWKNIPEIGMTIKPAYPNPDANYAFIEISITQPDTVFVSFNITRNGRAWPYEELYPFDKAGTYQLRIPLSFFPNGLYRVYITINRNGKSYQTYGDIRVKYP